MTYPQDNFRHGKITKYFPQGGYGFVRDEGGKEVYFHLDEIRLLGEKKDRSLFREGVEIGFDVGLTSRGLRVTRMRLY
ncbi:MAG: cold shock domain-containing protein [Deltaproteobacteria bacterium]|nr:cold shock domain-containing protein [Deltaproteobacteria bacterium]MBI4196413.1 cold shock domain-containing protein [Deltaproteobacteria bacterium]